MEISRKIIEILDENKISYESIDHEEALTCKQAARFRKIDISTGGKTILFKDKSDFRLFTLNASLEVDSNKVRKILKSQRLRFATESELMEHCQVQRGALPPIVRDLYPFDHYLDRSLLDNERIAFNCGILTRSIIITMEDFLTLVNPTIGDFSK